MRSLGPLVALVLAAVACAPGPAVPTAVENAQGAVALALPFVEDDYARALGEARSKNLPLFIEAWAPW